MARNIVDGKANPFSEKVRKKTTKMA